MEDFIKRYEALKGESQRLIHDKHRFKEKNRLLQYENRHLKRLHDEQKYRNILKCPLCHRTFNESWKVLGCGHMLCKDCVEDIKSKGSVFEYPCPYPECKKPIQSCRDFYPNVVDA